MNTTPSKPTTPSRHIRTMSMTSTPKRPTSAMSFSSSTSTSSLSSSTSTLLGSTHKRYKAPLSVESKPRPKSQATILSPIQSSPSRPASRAASRPRTPGTPSRKLDIFDPGFSENDVSVIDPEEKTIDYSTIEPEADASFELDEDLAWIQDHGKENKVQVSIRIRPSDGPSALVLSPSTNSLSIASNLNSSTQPFNFDAILTGSPNKPIYNKVARSHVRAAMDGYNTVIFAYGQTASGKTYTLSGAPPPTDIPGDRGEPGIIPRAMKDVFSVIRATPTREYLLRCSYLEIYNETVYDLLAPPATSTKQPVQIHGGNGPNEIVLSPLREEVVTSLKSVKEVLRRGESNRRTACTDWNERSSRSHSIFRMVIESRERGSGSDDESSSIANGRCTPATPSGKRTPGLGGPRLQSKDGKGVTTSVLSLIDLAGSEKATSDKERTREGKYINTSLLTLGTVIGTLADNASRKKTDHVPYRNSKLTRLLQPSLAGNARISVVCTLNPDPSAIAETLSTLSFAKRIKGVALNAQKTEVLDTDALLERYRKEIEELKARLAEKEKEAPVFKRRLSAREQVDESNAMKDLNARIQQLTKLILTSQTVEIRGDGDESRPASPVKVDFNMSPYQLQQELLSARLQLESQSTQILSLEAALESRPPVSPDADENERDKLIADQKQRIEELEGTIRTSNDNELREEIERKVRQELEKEWAAKLAEEERKRNDHENWAQQVVKELEKEKKQRQSLEGERRALQAFVSMFDSLGLGTSMPSFGPSLSLQRSSLQSTASKQNLPPIQETPSTTRTSLSDPIIPIPHVTIDVTGNQIGLEGHQELMREAIPDDADGWNDTSFGQDGEEQDEVAKMLISDTTASLRTDITEAGMRMTASPPTKRVVFADMKDKENIAPASS